MYIRGLKIKFANFDFRGIVHYEFVPTGQISQPSLLILGNVFPVVCAKLISRKVRVYNTTKCF